MKYEAIAKEVIELHSNGVSLRVIGKMFGIDHPQKVKHIIDNYGEIHKNTIREKVKNNCEKAINMLNEELEFLEKREDFVRREIQRHKDWMLKFIN